jgi:Flp pilus assembly protein TadD
MINNSSTRVNAESRIFFPVVFAVLAVWSATLTFGFVWDDYPTIVTNGSLLDWSVFFRAFSNDFWGLHEVPATSGYWRPMPTVVYAITAHLFGKSPWAFHAVNLIFHLGVCLSVVQLLTLLKFGRLEILLTSLVFALHPLSSEPVSFISALPDLMSAFFGLQALAFWLRGSRTGLIVGFLFFALSLLSKESSLVFPLVWPAILLSGNPGRLKLKRLFFSWSSSVVLALVYLFLHHQVVGGFGVRHLWGGGFSTHIGTVFKLFPFSFLLSIAPWGATPTRPFPLSTGLAEPWVWVSAAAFLGVAVLWWRLRQAGSRLHLGFLLFVLFWLPVSNLIPAEGLIADRYLYLPSLGTSILIGCLGAGILASFRNPKWARVLITGGLIAWGAVAFHRARPWQDEGTLWAHAVRVSPTSPVAWNEWGRLSLRSGDLSLAREAFHKALAIRSDYREASLNLAVLDLKGGDLVRADALTRGILAKWPEDPEAWDLRASLEDARGDLNASLEASRRAARLAPRNWKYRYNLGTVFLKMGKTEEAVGSLEKARSMAPDRSEVLMNLGAAYFTEGSFRKAEEVYLRVLSIDPKNERAAGNLKLVRERAGSVNGAARE